MTDDLRELLEQLSAAVAEALIDNQIASPDATKLRQINEKVFRALQKTA